MERIRTPSFFFDSGTGGSARVARAGRSGRLRRSQGDVRKELSPEQADGRVHECVHDRRRAAGLQEAVAPQAETYPKRYRMSALEELFDDANGDLAIGELESAVEKYGRCVELDRRFRWLDALGMAFG